MGVGLIAATVVTTTASAISAAGRRQIALVEQDGR